MRIVVMPIILACIVFSWADSWGEDFLGAPVMPGGKTISSEESRLEKMYDMGYQDVLKYYQDAFKYHENVKFWDRKKETYIEDHNSRHWHSITITDHPEGTKVVLIEDSWTWMISMLFFRFMAVFAVLLALYIAMSLSGMVLSRFAPNAAEKK